MKTTPATAHDVDNPNSSLATLPRGRCAALAPMMASVVACVGILSTTLAFAQEGALETEATSAARPTTTSAADGGKAAPSGEKTPIHVAIAAADPAVQAFNEHLVILASPWMEGRLPGTRGMERAMEYMEDQFIKAGLEPAFQPKDGSAKTYRQPFSLGGKREVAEQAIALKSASGETKLEADTDFKLTSLGKSGTAEGAVCFVGYGIEDGPDGYSSFGQESAAADTSNSLEGKIAFVFRFEPMDENGNSRWNGGSEGWSGRAGFAGKIGAVAKRKPAAIIVVNTPGANDPRIDSLSTSGGGRAMAEVPVFMMSTKAAESLLTGIGEKRSLLELRQLADVPPADGPRIFDLGNGSATTAISGRFEERNVVAENIVGVLPGRGALAKEVIVIGGHLDHLGQGDFGSREGPGKLHPGADDNASGSAGVILLGDMLKRDYDALPPEMPLRTILFIGFSAEESGLNGSRHYVDNPIYPIGDTVLMMNFDMIGRIKDNRLAVTSSAGVKGMKEWADGFYAQSPLTVVAKESSGGGGGGSDHASFMAVGVPILFAIIADFHDDYHTSRDTYDLIDREASVKAVELWHQLALDMAKREKRFEVEANSGPMRAQPMRVRAGLRTRESDDGNGLEVIDVTKDGSADKAGILKGDRLIKWNKQDLADREQFVEELRKSEPGDKVQAVVLRNGEEKTVYVELQAARRTE